MTKEEILEALRTGDYAQFKDQAASRLYRDLYDADIAVAGEDITPNEAQIVGDSVTAFLTQYGLLESNKWNGDAFDVQLGEKFVAADPGAGAGADPGAGAGAEGGGEVDTGTPDWGFLEKPSAGMYGWDEFGKPGQYQQFLGGLGDIGGYGGLTRGGRQWIQNQFDPLAAGYALQSAFAPFQGTGTDPMMGAAGGFNWGVPSTPVSFKEYMQTGGGFRGGTGAAFPAIGGEGGYLPGAPGGFRPSQQQFEQAFKAMTPLYGRQDFDDWVSKLDPTQMAAMKWMGEDRNIAQNLITQYGMGQVAPMFQNQVSSMLEPAFAEFYTRPEAQTGGGLMGQFLRSGIGGLGGWAP